MKITLNQKQMDFLKSNAINTGFVAGFGSGKSYVSTLKTIIKKVSFPKCTAAYYLPTYGLIRDIAFEKFPDMLSEMGYKYKLNKSDKEIHIKDYGKIIFRSMENPENIVGFETFYTIIDECDILPQDKMNIAYNKILGRNRQVVPVEDINVLNEYKLTNIPPKGTYLHDKLNILCLANQMDIVGTPEGFKFFYKRYVKEFNQDTDLLIKASTYDNKHLPSTYIKGLEQQYPINLLRAYLSGEFVNLNSGTIYSYFNRETHHSNEDYKKGETIYVSQDFNYLGCISIVYVKRNGFDVAIDEIISNDTKSIIANIKNRYPDSHICIYPDASGNAHKTSSSTTDIQMLRQAGFTVYVNNSNPSVRDRINITNNLFDKQKVKVNTNKCPKFTEALEQHSYDEKTGEPCKYSGGATVDDFTDGGTYYLAYEYPMTQKSFKVQVSTY